MAEAEAVVIADLWPPPEVTATLEGPDEPTAADDDDTVFEAVAHPPAIFDEDRKGNNESKSPCRTTSSSPWLRTSATGQDWLNK